jgi:hypothetical protein
LSILKNKTIHPAQNALPKWPPFADFHLLHSDKDYDLKGCMKGGFLEITLSGST